MSERTCVATYVWIDDKQHVRSKYRTLRYIINRGLHEIPPWAFDGPAANQADTEVILMPVRRVRDPFSDDPADIIVLCECYSPSGAPLLCNTRHKALLAFGRGTDMHPWFGLEQQYVLCDGKTLSPFMWETYFDESRPPKHGTSYCGVGAAHVFGRAIALEHMRACLTAGLSISGVNSHMMPSQWEFQIGPEEGIRASDDLWIARYILDVVCERHGVKAVLHPKPKRNFAGSALHVNYSNDETRSPEGIRSIYMAISCLESLQTTHMPLFGKGNELRLGASSPFEVPPLSTFTYGIGDKDASIRIPAKVCAEGHGYFEDRRPGANSDPYVITSTMHDAIAHAV